LGFSQSEPPVCPVATPSGDLFNEEAIKDQDHGVMPMAQEGLGEVLG